MQNSKSARELIKILSESHSIVPPELQEMSMYGGGGGGGGRGRGGGRGGGGGGRYGGGGGGKRERLIKYDQADTINDRCIRYRC